MLETAILQGTGEAGLHAVTVWLRYSATRQLTWNRNYNVKPREVSAAQVRPPPYYIFFPHLNARFFFYLVQNQLSSTNQSMEWGGSKN